MQLTDKMHPDSLPSAAAALPAGVRVFQRGWLSSNNILVSGKGHAALIDSGYCSHSTQTVALVQNALAGQPLDLLLNTHLHSDHCGGNAALQAAYPQMQTHIPPGLATAVAAWSPATLSFEATGQSCPPFGFGALLLPGSEIRLGNQTWQVHAAPGHDPHSVVLFEPAARLLISADALWENGFGVVFPELEGTDAFDSVGATLDLIASLAPRTIIPGHGSPFSDLQRALHTARTRLDYFQRSPQRHRNYAAKVLLKFKLLELQHTTVADLTRWALATPYIVLIGQSFFQDTPPTQVVQEWIAQLVSAGAATADGEVLYNRD
jgi:glyoxylase-like metal-dependent hydrolase (beta-lactamase superfamily II)